MTSKHNSAYRLSLSVALIVLLSGCSTAPREEGASAESGESKIVYVDPPSDPPVFVRPACVGNSRPPSARVPTGFRPVEALVCGEKFRKLPRELTSGEPYSETRYRGDFAAALQAFARKDRRYVTETGKPVVVCMAGLVRLPELWLIGSDGLGFIPRYPQDECNTSDVRALNEIQMLSVVSLRMVN